MGLLGDTDAALKFFRTALRADPECLACPAVHRGYKLAKALAKKSAEADKLMAKGKNHKMVDAPAEAEAMQRRLQVSYRFHGEALRAGSDQLQTQSPDLLFWWCRHLALGAQHVLGQLLGQRRVFLQTVQQGSV